MTSASITFARVRRNGSGRLFGVRRPGAALVNCRLTSRSGTQTNRGRAEPRPTKAAQGRRTPRRGFLPRLYPSIKITPVTRFK
jgi:hypothetical protein